MPYQLTYENDGFLLVHTGIITIQEINESNGLIHGHPEFDSHRYQIVDLLEADFSEILLANANQPGATDWAASKTASNIQVAMVVEETNAKAFCEEYISTTKQLGSDWEFGLFPSREQARKWLDL